MISKSPAEMTFEDIVAILEKTVHDDGVDPSFDNGWRACIRAIRKMADLTASIASEDTIRMEWMEQNLCRAGEVRNNLGQVVKLARVWSIMGELDTLRETVDAAMVAYEKQKPS